MAPIPEMVKGPGSHHLNRGTKVDTKLRLQTLLQRHRRADSMQRRAEPKQNPRVWGGLDMSCRVSLLRRPFCKEVLCPDSTCRGCMRDSGAMDNNVVTTGRCRLSAFAS